MKKLKGYKTYLCVIAWGVLSIVKAQGWFEVPDSLLIAVLAAGGLSLRSGIGPPK